jgi:NAD(P)-dependent dehydrogenase (short-subunit alcohol dehydrogenase family)
MESKNQVAIVTGGASGIGLESARLISTLALKTVVTVLLWPERVLEVSQQSRPVKPGLADEPEIQ